MRNALHGCLARMAATPRPLSESNAGLLELEGVSAIARASRRPGFVTVIGLSTSPTIRWQAPDDPWAPWAKEFRLPTLRDTENVPLSEDVETYFAREVLPHAPDPWIDHDKTKVGYEIPFNRHFYVFEPPRALEEIDADLAACTDRIKAMIEGLTA
jgi:hypothetical protein